MITQNNWLVKYNVEGEYHESVINNTDFNSIDTILESHHNCLGSELYIISVERYVRKHTNDEIP